VRVIAATNEDIEKAVDEGRFRFDLWQRVDEYTLEVPSLGDCPEDVLPLAEELLKRFNGEFHKTIEGFTDEAKKVLQSHRWPGNVRELKNVIRCAVVETTGSMIDAGSLILKAVPRKEKVFTLKDDEGVVLLVLALLLVMMCAQQNIIIKQVKENSNGLLHIDSNQYIQTDTGRRED